MYQAERGLIQGIESLHNCGMAYSHVGGEICQKWNSGSCYPCNPGNTSEVDNSQEDE